VFRVHGPALQLLKEFGKLSAGGVVHSYSGSAELVRDYLKLGWSFSFAGAVTRSNAKRPLDAARAVPLEHLVVETDAPFQPTGADARDRKRGDPADLPQVVDAIARARGLDPEELAARTTENARRIFRTFT
jgi:TatD DNase family protein